MNFQAGNQVHVAPHAGEPEWQGFLVQYSDGLKAIGHENLVCEHAEYWTLMKLKN